jgi:hypothetical protein
MKYGVEMDSDAMICIPSFRKIGSGIQKLVGGGGGQTHRHHGGLISINLFFLNKEMRLKTTSKITVRNVCDLSRGNQQ